MLIYNLERIYRARGIERPYSFFKANGYSDSFSAKLKHGRVTGMKLETLEKVCLLLHCTPHDLLEFQEDSSTIVSKDHPIRILESKNKPPDISVFLKSAPLELMVKFRQMIEDEGNKDQKSKDEEKKAELFKDEIEMDDQSEVEMKKAEQSEEEREKDDQSEEEQVD